MKCGHINTKNVKIYFAISILISGLLNVLYLSKDSSWWFSVGMTLVVSLLIFGVLEFGWFVKEMVSRKKGKGVRGSDGVECPFPMTFVLTPIIIMISIVLVVVGRIEF